MTLLLQISDTHFGTEQPTVVSALERFVREQRPDVLLFSGDITQRATQSEFAAAKRFVDGLGIASVLAIPGNHDIPLFAMGQRVFTPYGRYGGAFGAELEPVIDLPDCQVLAVNTTRWYRHKNGEVSSRQIERVARVLGDKADERLRVVMVHQPVAVTREKDRANLLIGHQRAVDVWSEAGADLIVGGHIHLPFVVPLDGATRRVWCVQAGTAVSSRTRNNAPNSVNLIRVMPHASGRRCEVAQWDYGADAGKFGCVRMHNLALSPRVQPGTQAPAHAG